MMFNVITWYCKNRQLYIKPDRFTFLRISGDITSNNLLFWNQ